MVAVSQSLLLATSGSLPTEYANLDKISVLSCAGSLLCYVGVSLTKCALAVASDVMGSIMAESLGLLQKIDVAL